ncbi:hypothetical protein NP493_2079g00007 [Ridgeia piscesae]|uniref:Piwi-like protein 1 n=1 Tax=Ridgeia piscesae TaxID=27915 RepID=A0AAD9JLX5_RIDPI|nr:hypothetical protein NP493_2079g00007 [Ridgeia piscesae]
MAAMSIEPGGGDRRNRFEYFEERTTRPEHVKDKRGTAGGSIGVLSNFFQLKQAPDFHMFQYHVDFSPDIENKNMRQRLVKEHRELLGKARAFDGMLLFMARKLEQPVTEVYSTMRDNTKVRITITFVTEVPPNSPTMLQMFNIIFRRILNMIDMKQIGRHYYSPESGVTIPQHKLEVWPGFVTSISQYEHSIMLMADISHKILRSNTVLDVMYEMYNTGMRDFHGECSKKLIGEIVLTRYNNKTYRVDDIDWEKNPDDKFKTFDGSEISFVDYYKKHHNIDVRDGKQPLLVSRPKKKDIRRGMDGPILLLPELCTLTGLSEEVRSDFHVMKDLATHTRIAPEGRYQTLSNFIEKINKNPEVKEEMSRWGLAFDRDLLSIQARVLPPEKIRQRGQVYDYKPADADWSREMRGHELEQCVPLDQWIMLFTRRDAPKAHDFLQSLGRVGPPMGIRVNKPVMCELPDDHTQTYLRTLEDQVGPNTQMAVCLLPTNKKDRYDAIKKFCCVTHPVPSQVIVGRTLAKKQMLMSVATKIAIQLNCKLGGDVWCVEIPLKNLMVVGIDCYHDSAKKGRSIGAFIASMNSKLTRYYSRCTFQHTMQELMDGLKVCMQASLKKYNEINGCLPERIVIYRDGVGDGQLNAVIDHEIPQLKECFKALGADYNPRLAVVIVKKRINARFFAKAGQRLNNPPPGTVIDDHVTRKEWYDFFLVSQSVRQGTVTPTAYNVVVDSSGMKPDHMQRLTYKLCHLYYNWPGTIRVPAPCQYAHKLAFLVGQSLHQDPSLALADKLYYL